MLAQPQLGVGLPAPVQHQGSVQDVVAAGATSSAVMRYPSGARVASSVSALTARETVRCDTLNRSPMAVWGIWRRQIDVAHSDLATSRIAGMV